MASSSGSVQFVKTQVFSVPVPSIQDVQEIVAAVREIARASGCEHIFNESGVKSNGPAQQLEKFLENGKFLSEVFKLFKSSKNTSQSGASKQLLAKLSHLAIAKLPAALEPDFGFLNEKCVGILKVANLPSTSQKVTISIPPAFNFPAELSVLCQQLLKLRDDSVKHHFPDYFKAFLLAYGMCLFFQKAKARSPASEPILSPGFYVPAGVALHISPLVLSLGQLLPEVFVDYASKCFSENDQENEFVQENFKRKANERKKLNTLDHHSIQSNSSFLLVLLSLPMLFYGLQFCIERFKNNASPVGFSSDKAAESCQFFGGCISGCFSGFSTLAHGISDPINLLSKLSELKSEYSNLFHEFLNCPVIVKNLGKMSLLKATMQNNKMMSLCVRFSHPVFYPVFFEAVLKNKNADGERIELDKMLTLNVAQSIENYSFRIWMNAMLHCGLVCLDKGKVQLVHNSWNHGESSGFHLFVGTKNSDLTDQQIGGFSEDRSVFMRKYAGCLFKVVCNSGSVFDLVKNRSDLISENKISFFALHSGHEEEITMSIRNLSLINELFSIMADGNLIAMAVVDSLKNPDLTLQVRLNCIKQVDGFSYVKPTVMKQQDEYSYMIDVGFLSPDLISKLSMGDGEQPIYSQLSVQLVLNEQAANFGFVSHDTLGHFLKENTLYFSVCDESDLKKPVFYPIPLSSIPDCFFEKLVSFIQIYPFLPTMSPADEFLHKLALAPSSAQVLDTSVQQTDADNSKVASLVSTLSEPQLLQAWGGFNRAAQASLLAACTVPQKKFIVNTLTTKQFQDLFQHLSQDQKQSLRDFLHEQEQQKLEQMESNQNSPVTKSSTKLKGRSSKGKLALGHKK